MVGRDNLLELAEDVELRLNRCECLAGSFELLLELRQRLTRERTERFSGACMAAR